MLPRLVAFWSESDFSAIFTETSILHSDTGCPVYDCCATSIWRHRVTSGISLVFLSQLLTQRFSNWGPRTKGGPRRVPTGSARRFRKVVIVCTVFNNSRSICFQICTHKSVTQSQCIAWKCCRGLARHAGFLLMSLSSAARDLLTI